MYDSSLPSQSPREWLEMFAAADLGLVSFRSDLAGLNVPSKVYTLMSADRPILASVPEDSEVALVQRQMRELLSPLNCHELSNRFLISRKKRITQ